MRAKASEPDVVTHCKLFQQLLQLVERVLTATAREVIRELVHLRYCVVSCISPTIERRELCPGNAPHPPCDGSLALQCRQAPVTRPCDGVSGTEKKGSGTDRALTYSGTQAAPPPLCCKRTRTDRKVSRRRSSRGEYAPSSAVAGRVCRDENVASELDCRLPTKGGSADDMRWPS